MNSEPDQSACLLACERSEHHEEKCVHAKVSRCPLARLGSGHEFIKDRPQRLFDTRPQQPLDGLSGGRVPIVFSRTWQEQGAE